MLIRKARTLRKTAKALTDPRPEFVSLVFAGANKSPFRALRADGQVEGDNSMTDSSAIKAETHALARVDFFQTHFADEAAVKNWLVEGGYVGMKVEKTDDGFAVIGDNVEGGTLIDLSDTLGLKMTVVALRQPVLELTEVHMDSLAPAIKADDASPALPLGVAEMRTKFGDCFDMPSVMAYSTYGQGGSVSEVMENNFQGVPPGLLDVMMATYDAVRNNLLMDNEDGARACVTEFGTLFDKMLAMFPDDDDANEDDDMATKAGTATTGLDVANTMQNTDGMGKPSKTKPGVSNDGPRVDPEIMNADGTIQGPGVASSSHNTDIDIVTEDGATNTVVSPNSEHGDGKINANGNKEPVANSMAAQESGAITPSGSGTADVANKRKSKAAFLAAIAPEITVAKEATAVKDEGTEVPETPAVEPEASPTVVEGESVVEAPAPIEITPVAPEADTDDVVVEAAKAVDANDPIAALTALVGTLAQSMKAMQETQKSGADELAERVAAMENVRQTRKSADVDEATVAVVEPETEARTRMAELRTRGVLGMRSLPPQTQR